MKPLDEKKVWAQEILEQDRRLAITMLIQQQIDIVANLMERHQDMVKSPLHYNMCCGLIDQLRAHSSAAMSEMGSTALPMMTEQNPTYFRFTAGNSGS
jgi:hypothetical protein